MMRPVILTPLLALLAACSGQSQVNAANGTMAQSTADTLDGFARQQQDFLAQLTPDKGGWQSSASGLRYRRVAGPGRGPHPTLADTVNITYSGKLIDGTQFDASETPVDLPLARLISGWKEGIPLMSVGDTYEFAMASDLGYGPEGSGPIPGGAALLFTVRLVAIR